MRLEDVFRPLLRPSRLGLATIAPGGESDDVRSPRMPPRLELPGELRDNVPALRRRCPLERLRERVLYDVQPVSHAP